MLANGEHTPSGRLYRMCALGNVFDVTVLLRDTEANKHTRTHARTEHTYGKQHTALAESG